MRNSINLAFLVLIIFTAFSANARHYRSKICPKAVGTHLIRLLRKQESLIQIPFFAPKRKVSGGEGLDEVHTRLPPYAKKFEDTVTLLLPPIPNDDGTYSCIYSYKKAFGQCGYLELKVKPILDILSFMNAERLLAPSSECYFEGPTTPAQKRNDVVSG